MLLSNPIIGGLSIGREVSVLRSPQKLPSVPTPSVTTLDGPREVAASAGR